MASEVGQGVVPILPIFKGFRRGVTKEIEAAERDGSARFRKGFAKSSSAAGTTAGKGFRKGFTASTSGLGKQMQADVAKAARAVSASRLKEQDAAGKVRVAEAQLAEARKKYAADSSQVIRAEERLASAQRGLSTAQETTRGATDQLTAAQKRLAEASEDASRRTRTGFQDIMSNVSGALGSVSGVMSSVSAKLTEVGGALTSRITKPALGAMTVVGGLVAALGFKRLVGIDTARGQFKGLGHDADAVMAQVDKGVTNTALSMAEGASLAVGILATGNLPLEQLESQLKRVANVSAAYGVDASQAGYLLNNVLTKNKVTYGDLSQMVQNQIPIISQLADYYGVAGDEIEGMAQRGEISVADLNAVLDKNAGAAAKEYANTWKGVTANILANLGKIGAKMLGSSFDVLKESAGELLVFLQSSELSAWAEDVGAKIGNFALKASEAIRNLIGWWSGLSPAVQKSIGVFAGLAVAAGPVLTIAGKIAGVVGVVAGVMSKLTGVVARIAPAISKFTGSLVKIVPGLGGAAGGASKFLSFLGRFAGPIGLVVTGLVAMWTQSEKFREGIASIGQSVFGIFQKIYEAIAPIVEMITSALMPIFQKMGDLLGQIFSQVAPILGQIGTAVGGVLTALMPLVDLILNILTPVFEGLMAVVQTVFNALGPIIDAALQIITGIVQVFTSLLKGDWDGVWNGLWMVLQGVWNLIVGIVQGAIDIVVSVISGALTALQGIWNAIWGAIGGTVTSVWNGIVSFLSGVAAWVGGAFTSAWSGLTGFFSGLWSGISNGVTSAWNGVISFFSGIPGKIKGFFSGVGSWLLDSGRSLIQGFIDGITGMIDNVGSAIGGVMDFVGGFFPHSPAKRGPFSGAGWRRVADGGSALIEQFASGADRASLSGPLRRAVQGAINLGDVSARVAVTRASTGAVGSGAGGSFEFNSYTTDPRAAAHEAFELFRRPSAALGGRGD